MNKKRLCFAYMACFAMLALFSLTAHAQTQVTGKVTTEDKQPIVGATVTVKGTTVATATGPGGIFNITVPSGRNTLVVTFAEHDDIEVDAAGGAINVTLKAKTSTLNEVVVTGYTSQARKDITGSVSVVKVADMQQQPAANAETQLQGRAAGVTVIQSNQPGDGASVRIRGIASFTNNNPLYVIDGVQTGGLGNVNPNDIESIQVLKDAAAASIYGAAAFSGVVIVTTKKGRQGSAKVSYNMYYGSQKPGKGFDLLNSQEMADLTWLAYRNAGQTPPPNQYGNGATPVLPDYILPAGTFEGNPAVNPALYNLNMDDIPGSYLIHRANKVGTNWFEEITDAAPIMNHNLAVSGGADKSRYYFSFDYFDHDGIVIHNFYRRNTARINTEFNVKNTIRIGENVAVIYSQDNRAGNNNEGTEIAMAYRNQPIIPIYDIMGNFAGSRGANLGNASNPVATRIRAKNNRGNNVNVIGNIYAEADILKHITLRSSFGGEMNSSNWYFYTYKTYENSENNTNNRFTEGSWRGSQYIWTNQATYRNIFANDHELNLLVGTEARKFNIGRSMEASRIGYFIDDNEFVALNTGSGQQTNNGAPSTPITLLSYFAKADYVFKDKYLASFTIRRDGSSVFSEDLRYGNFPAFSLGWRISREDFMQDLSWLSDLKIRGSYGTMGNSGALANNSLNLFGGAAGSSFYDINGTSGSGIFQGFQQTQLGNPKGKWEEQKTTNIGFDAVLFKGKTEVIFDWYTKNSKDLLFRLEQPGTGGAAGSVAPPFYNVASMKNTGIDLAISHRANVGGAKGVRLDGTVTFTTVNNEIVEIAEGIDNFEAGGSRIGNFVRNAKGHPIGSFFGYEVVGLFQDAGDVTRSPTQDGAAPGRFKYRDADGNGTINANDRVYFGDPNPDFTYGLQLNAGYSSFDLSMFFYGVSGAEAINYVKWWTDFFPSFQGAKSKAALYESWLPTRTNTNVPIAENVSNFSNNGVPNSYYLENASYFRAKYITLGYSLPAKLINRISIDKLRIYVQATNPFTITKYTGMDPEIIGGDQARSIDAGAYPTVKQWTFGLNLNF